MFRTIIIAWTLQFFITFFSESYTRSGCLLQSHFSEVNEAGIEPVCENIIYSLCRDLVVISS